MINGSKSLTGPSDRWRVNPAPPPQRQLKGQLEGLSIFFGGWGYFFEWKRLGNRGYLVLSCANRPFPLVSLALQTEQIKTPNLSNPKEYPLSFFFYPSKEKGAVPSLSLDGASPPDREHRSTEDVTLASEIDLF